MKRALCNEILQPRFSVRRWIEKLEFVQSLGYQGVEIAPFTLGEDPAQVDPSELRSIRRILEETGVRCIGFHWLWSAPVGLRGLHPDPSIRSKAWHTLHTLAWQCAGLGGEFLVLGSGKQRSFEGMSISEAKRFFMEELVNVLPVLEETGVTLLIEPLPGSSTNFLNTLEEVESVLKEIDSPFLGTVFDFHNTVEETLPWEQLIQKFRSSIRHVHFNGVNGGLPPQLDPLYVSAFRALQKTGYTGWVSVEVFGEFTNSETLLTKVRNLLDGYEGNGCSDVEQNHDTGCPDVMPFGVTPSTDIEDDQGNDKNPS